MSTRCSVGRDTCLSPPAGEPSPSSTSGDAPRGCDLIIFRVHSTVNEDLVWFFTGEEYSQDKYVLEQPVDEGHQTMPSLGSERLFAVGADFVNPFMKNRFRGSVVMVMGCDGIRSTDLTPAFIDNGAKVYVSWDGPVTLEHMNLAFSCLLRALIEEGMNPKEAVTRAMNTVGRDPDYNSSLTCFPCLNQSNRGRDG